MGGQAGVTARRMPSAAAVGLPCFAKFARGMCIPPARGAVLDMNKVLRLLHLVINAA
jgi:hypothetical protein